MRELQFSIPCKTHPSDHLRGKSGSEMVWPCSVLSCIGLPFAKWMQIHIVKKEIVSFYPCWYPFSPKPCNVRTCAPYKWKSICYLRLSYSSSPSSVATIFVQPSMCGSPECKCHFFLAFFMYLWSQRRLEVDSADPCLSEGALGRHKVGGFISVRDRRDPPHSCFNTEVL